MQMGRSSRYDNRGKQSRLRSTLLNLLEAEGVRQEWVLS